MTDNPLKVVPIAQKKEAWVSEKKSNRQEAIAKFNRLWLINPEQFNPLKNCMEIERIARTVALFPDIAGKVVVDLGCGEGVLTRQLCDKGAYVDAVDVSTNALKALQQGDCTHITPLQDYVPRTKLTDDKYDLVVATELVAYLPKEEFRLFMSELSRLVKANGKVICSTPFAMDSTDAIDRFIDLSETEFQIDEWKFSYHLYWLRINNFLDAPARFARASKDADYRKLKLEERSGFYKNWFRWNSSKYLAWLWKLKSYISIPIHSAFKNNKSLLLWLEKMCKAVASTDGISHVIWIGKRRPLVEFTPKDEQEVERKGKKQVWE
jgi:2-polyprenyl-3-methyl-5-hydroxy-6-metoxy-1,4-benzoquinol methylase